MASIVNLSPLLAKVAKLAQIFPLLPLSGSFVRASSRVYLGAIGNLATLNRYDDMFGISNRRDDREQHNQTCLRRLRTVAAQAGRSSCRCISSISRVLDE